MIFQIHRNTTIIIEACYIPLASSVLKFKFHLRLIRVIFLRLFHNTLPLELTFESDEDYSFLVE